MLKASGRPERRENNLAKRSNLAFQYAMSPLLSASLAAQDRTRS